MSLSPVGGHFRNFTKCPTHFRYPSDRHTVYKEIAQKKGQTVTDEVHVLMPSMIYGIPYIYLTFDAIVLPSDMRVIRLGSGMKYS